MEVGGSTAAAAVAAAAIRSDEQLPSEVWANKKLKVSVLFQNKALPFKVFDVVAEQSWKVEFVLDDLEGVVSVQIGNKRITRQVEVRSENSLWVWGTSTFFTSNVPSVPVCFHNPLLAQITVDSVAASENHVLLLASSGQVFCCGSNEMGELGVGDLLPRPSLELVPLKTRATFVACRLNGSLVIDLQGTVFCSGIKLASGEHSRLFIVPDGMDVVRASCAFFVGDDVIALDSNRSLVYQFGSFGRTKKPYRAHVPPRFPDRVKLVAANLLHQLVITNSGQLFVAETAQFAPKMPLQDKVPFDPAKVISMQTSRCAAYFLLDNGNCYELFLSANRSDPQRYVNKNSVWKNLFKVPNIAAVAPGSYHSLFLDKSGQVWGVGASNEGQLGDSFEKSVAFAHEPRSIKVPKSFKIVTTQNFCAAILGQPKSHIGIEMLKVMKDDSFKDIALVNDAGERVSMHRIVLAARTKKEFWPRIESHEISCGSASLAVMQACAELIYVDRLSCDESLWTSVVELAEFLKLRDNVVCLARGEVGPKERRLEEDLADTVDCKAFSDFVIECDDGDPIMCHRVLLGRNPYFAALFSSSYLENETGRLRLQEASRNGVRLLLRFVVCDLLDAELSPDDCIDVLLVCNQLLLPELKRTLEMSLTKCIEPENCGFVYMVARRTACDSLSASCLAFARANWVDVLGSSLEHQIEDEIVRQEFFDLIRQDLKK